MNASPNLPAGTVLYQRESPFSGFLTTSAIGLTVRTSSQENCPEVPCTSHHAKHRVLYEFMGRDEAREYLGPSVRESAHPPCHV